MAKKASLKKTTKQNQRYYHAMLLPGMILLIIFNIIPMFGILMAFQNYVPAKGILGSDWVGLDHFRYMFQLPDSKQIFANTIIIAVGKLVVGMIVPIIFALILNEARVQWFKKWVQTIVYLPNFLSWVVLGTVVSMIFSYDGMFNNFLEFIGSERIMFLASNTWFRPLLIATDVWKSYGYGTIIYLAALTAINPALYESAAMDGANRFKQMIHITLPGILPTIVLLATLNLGSVLNAGFDQVFNLYNPIVYQTGDIIDTYVYRMGLVDMQFSFATAVGLLKSVVSFGLIVLSYKLADKFAGYRIF
ncbi:sugar ABC transporter permease [Vagococcus lutrae]|uniref:ABC transporter permease n=1 Tax=Vagococcus lutrae TaxID=81947 RepID=UPI0014439552|nr:ABC transporter permease subunit [Vagococcus lutrae]MDT2825015.1 ABC transporter permease subunit [Vagococcus lutrae]MDY3706925.1 ABC transporter permease subunit [Vagococcus lutrae]NKZ26849.1 sugar ABC transporter permease [Vagococcus lutrae]UQF18298.1 ABC transporter permease subunit [Vagococcus lutrae]WEB81512.1 ABC transporter permease subunit [Vagococcus lutrae]